MKRNGSQFCGRCARLGIIGAALLLAAVSALAGSDNVVITFSTVGPDTYADGTTVRDGESYALVWTPDGAAFGGLGTDGKAIAPSKVAIKAPVAKGGRCPNVQFQINEKYAARAYPGGTWCVCLLDTRTFATRAVRVTAADGREIEQRQVVLDADGRKTVTGVGGKVSGYGVVAASIGKSFGGGATAVGTAGALPDGITPPQVTDIRVVGDWVYLRMKGTSPDACYGVDGGETPSDLKPTGDNPVCGGEDGETTVITRRKGDSGFFRGRVR